jgi:hypothetical protein
MLGASNESKITLHLGYWIVILVLPLILVTTEKWSAQPKFTEYLSNAATMTSLLLGLVAIIYSFVSNDGLAKSLGSINTVSDEVRKSKEQISSFVQKTESANVLGDENRKALQEISSSLSTNLEALHTALETVAAQTGALPSRLEKIEDSFSEITRALGTKPPVAQSVGDSTRDFWTSQAVAKFLKTIPLGANLLCHAAVLAKMTGKELSIADFCTRISSNTPSFFSGLLSAMEAASLIDRAAVEGKERTFAILATQKDLADQSRKYFISFIERVYKEREEEKALWQGKLAAVEAMFA